MPTRRGTRKPDAGKGKTKNRKASRMPAVESAPPKPMPDSKTLNALFLKTITELNMPAQNKEIMMKQSDAKKWELVQLNSQFLDSKGGGATALDWVNKLKKTDPLGTPEITAKDAKELHTALRTGHRSFLMQFIEEKGIQELNRATMWFGSHRDLSEDQGSIIFDLVGTYKVILNNTLGMEAALEVEGTMTAVVLCIDYDISRLHQDGEVGSPFDLTIEVMDLLSVTSFTSELGRQAVVDAFQSYKVRRKEFLRFQTLVYMLESCDDVRVKHSIATFITTVCNSTRDMNKRVEIRNDFLSLEVIGVFERIKVEQQFAKTEVDKGLWVDIMNQYQVFVQTLKADQVTMITRKFPTVKGKDGEEDELVTNEKMSDVDLSNIDDVWALVMKQNRMAGCPNELLAVTQALLFVPSEKTLAAPVYTAIAAYIREASSLQVLSKDKKLLSRDNFTEPPELNYATLTQLHEKKLDMDAKISQVTTSDKIIKMQADKIQALQNLISQLKTGKVGKSTAMEVTEADSAFIMMEREKMLLFEINELKLALKRKGEPGFEDVEVIPRPTGLSPSGGTKPNKKKPAAAAAAATGGSSKREKELEAEVAKLKKELAEAKKAGPPALPKPSGGGGAAAKATAAAGAGGGGSSILKNFTGKLDSTGLVPAGIAPGAKKIEIPACPTSGAPGSLDNAPLKPKTESGGAAAGGGGAEKKGPSAKQLALQKLGLKEKKSEKPNIKMTHLFWTAIPPQKLEGTIWLELSDDNVKFDKHEVEALFGKQKKRGMGPRTQSIGTMRAEEFKVIGGAGAQNYAIALRKTGLGPVNLAKAIYTLEDTLLLQETTLILTDNLPSAEDVEAMNAFISDHGDVSKLNPVDRYVYEIVTMGNAKERLDAVRTLQTFDDSIQKIYDVIGKVSLAMSEIKASKELKTVLEVVLAIGNYTNAGTPRGGAYGFRLSALSGVGKLKDNIGRPMHAYLYELFEDKHPNVLKWRLPKCSGATTVALSEFNAELNSLAGHLQGIKGVYDGVNKARADLKAGKESKIRVVDYDKFEERMKPFEEHASTVMVKAQKDFEELRTNFQKFAEYFGEPGNKTEPGVLFTYFLEFIEGMKKAGRAIQAQKLKERKAQKMMEEKKNREVLHKLNTMRKADVDFGLIDAFRNAQKGPPLAVVDNFINRWYPEQATGNVKPQNNGPPRAKKMNKKARGANRNVANKHI